jgi:hypothetical protein
MRLFPIFLSLTALVAATSIALSKRSEVSPKVQTKSFVKKLGPYKVSLSETSDWPLDGNYWGEFGDIPDIYVNQLRVWDEGDEIDVPVSCYSDLATVGSLKITPIKDGLVIDIGGGDAAVSYWAQIVLKDDQVVRRSVHSGEMPDNHWEKTVYHDNYDDIQ